MIKNSYGVHMSDKKTDKKTESKKNSKYNFGGIKEYSLEEIESEVLSDSVYLDVFAGSDIRFKDQIIPIESGLELLKGINSYKYFYKAEEFKNKNFPTTGQIGFIAQEVEKNLPELVREDEQGFKAVNYAQITPVLTNAVQELNQIVEKQASLIEQLEERLLNLESNNNQEELSKKL